MNRRTHLLAAALAAAVGAAGLAASAPAAPAEEVLVIGDSLGVGMEPYLAPELGSLEVRTDAEIGRGSPAGVDVLRRELTPADDVIVFALGSNDPPSQPEILADSLEAANGLAAGRCLVVATLEVSGYSGVPEEPLNEVIEAFAAANPNVRLVDWHDAVTPDLLADGGHATPAGYELRASLFADAVASCASAPAGGDGIPKPDREALAEGRPRPEPARDRPAPEPIAREEAIEILADALAGQIAIGVLGG
jgi:hypothetical protein